MNGPPITPACLITGGSSGIGLATAQRFAREGWHVLICGRDEDRLRKAEATIRQSIPTSGSGSAARLLTRSVDVADAEGVRETVRWCQAELGGVHMLVNSAGVAPNAPVADMSRDEFDSVIATNITGVFNFVQAVWPIMRDGGGGHVVNISSQSAVDPFAGFSVYGASKAFVDLFTKAVAEEGKPHGIRVFSLRPGVVDTPLLRVLFPDLPADQTLSAEQVADLVWMLGQPALQFSVGDPISIKH